MDNNALSKFFYRLADLVEYKEEPFKARAYRRAARVIENYPEPIENLYKRGGYEALEALPGIGEAISKKVIEILATGQLASLESLQKEIPAIDELLTIEGIGPKRAKILFTKLGVKSIKDLKIAIANHKLQSIPMFGIKSEEHLRRSIEFHEQTRGRMILGEAVALAENLVTNLCFVSDIKVEIAGSTRRGRETVGDLDILVTIPHDDLRMEVLKRFTTYPDVMEVLSSGETKSTVRLKQGIEADLLIIPPDSLGAALMYFTGSKQFNIALRTKASQQGLKLNEYGLFLGETRKASVTEADIFTALGLPFIPPELREDPEVIAAASKNTLPVLIRPQELLGDLHVHTQWSTGTQSISVLAEEYHRRGFQYIAITDHISPLPALKGLSPKRLKQQQDEIDHLNRGYEDAGITFEILSGVEVDILANGSLAAEPALIRDLDVVIAGVHDQEQNPLRYQERLLAAMEDPDVNILAHPSGRIFGGAPGYPIDLDALSERSNRTGCFLEINCNPNRLDLRDIHIHQCLDLHRNMVFAVGTSSVTLAAVKNLSLGVTVARRGGASRRNILNSRPSAELKPLLRR